MPIPYCSLSGDHRRCEISLLGFVGRIYDVVSIPLGWVFCAVVVSGGLMPGSASLGWCGRDGEWGLGVEWGRTRQAHAALANGDELGCGGRCTRGGSRQFVSRSLLKRTGERCHARRLCP